MYWRFIGGLRKFLKEPITVEQARRVVSERLQNREPNFLTLARQTIFSNESSPYLKLLRLAGCEYGDIERLVGSDGIENTLVKLADKGVFVSYEEFKRGKEVIRGSAAFNFKETDFDNPLVKASMKVTSGGTRTAGATTVYDFDYMAAQREIHQSIYLDAAIQPGSPLLMWLPIMPGAGPRLMIDYYKNGHPPIKWFSPVASKNVRPSFKNRAATAYIVYAGRLFGARFPSPDR